MADVESTIVSPHSLESSAPARPRFPRPYQSESVKAWSDDEMNALLAVVKRLAESGSVVSKRDYPLLLFYLFTSLRRNEVISLRGKDLERKDDKLIYRLQAQGWQVCRQGSERCDSLGSLRGLSADCQADGGAQDGRAAVDEA
jgi:hypothetical protein